MIVLSHFKAHLHAGFGGALKNLRILASMDPIAINQASFDLVNRQPGKENSMLQKNHEQRRDKFEGVWDTTIGHLQIDH